MFKIINVVEFFQILEILSYFEELMKETAFLTPLIFLNGKDNYFLFLNCSGKLIQKLYSSNLCID